MQNTASVAASSVDNPNKIIILLGKSCVGTPCLTELKMEPVKMEHHVDNHQAGHRLSNDPNAVRTSLLSGYCQYQCQVRIFTKIRDLMQQDQLEDQTNASGSILFQQVRSDSCRHLLLTGMSRFLLSKPKHQDLLTV